MNNIHKETNVISRISRNRHMVQLFEMTGLVLYDEEELYIYADEISNEIIELYKADPDSFDVFIEHDTDVNTPVKTIIAKFFSYEIGLPLLKNLNICISFDDKDFNTEFEHDLNDVYTVDNQKIKYVTGNFHIVPMNKRNVHIPASCSFEYGTVCINIDNQIKFNRSILTAVIMNKIRLTYYDFDYHPYNVRKVI